MNSHLSQSVYPRIESQFNHTVINQNEIIPCYKTYYLPSPPPLQDHNLEIENHLYL